MTHGTIETQLRIDADVPTRFDARLITPGGYVRVHGFPSALRIDTAEHAEAPTNDFNLTYLTVPEAKQLRMMLDRAIKAAER